MQLSVLFSVLAATVAVTSASDVYGACIPEKDCCFSTKGACQRQSNFAVERYYECGNVKLCPALGVSVRDCR
ncbi:hypothetical protein G6011_09471 [Alternaria panax]|uniref:Uncharacterized protein n=1 Tax=Alternaria panax TaxID=48097 RepID=A0AAD4IBB9_9PLEO|nr:hypothetical protein G6011_09471 [Alternaria panax]